MNFSNEQLMWFAIAVWIGFAVFAVIGYYTSRNTAALPSGNTATTGAASI